MKNLLSLITLLSLLVVPTALTAASFEGKMKMKVTDEKKRVTELDYALKGNRVRIDMPTGKQTSTMIMDTDKQEILVLMPEQKMYLSMPLQEVAETAENLRKELSDSALEKTNETEKILGYTCTKYLTRDKDSVTELWLAEGLGAFMSMKAGSNPFKPAPRNKWEEEILKKGLFPLRTVVKNKAGKETVRMEVASVNKQSLPDSHFAVPEGYQRFDMGGMLRGMGGGLNPFNKQR